MHGKLRALLQKQEAIVDAAKAAGRDLTEEEQKRFDALQAEIDQAKAEDDAGEKEKEAREIAIKEERERAAGITALCRSFGMDPESYIASGKSMDEVRAAVLAELAKDRAPIGNRRMEVTGDEEDKFRQYYSDEAPEGIELIDFSDKTEEDVEEELLDLARSPLPNNYNDVQLYTAKLFRRPSGLDTLFFNGYHMIMDSVGLITVITYFFRVYQALVDGTELPAPGIGPEKHIEQSWKYMESKRWQADIDWWRAKFDKPPVFSSMNPKPSPEYVEGTNYGLPLRPDQYLCTSMPMLIPAETVEQINAAAAANNMSPQIYYALGLRTWLYKMSGSATAA